MRRTLKKEVQIILIVIAIIGMLYACGNYEKVSSLQVCGLLTFTGCGYILMKYGKGL